MVVSNCEMCGKEIKRWGSKKARFCSVDCKSQWQRDNKRKTEEEKGHLQTCKKCGKAFRSKWKNRQVYCSKDCKPQSKVYKCEICGKEFKRSGNICKTVRFCSISCKALSMEKEIPVSRDWLVQKYLTEELGTEIIANLVGVTVKRIWDWLKKYQIETRSYNDVAAKCLSEWRKHNDNPMKGRIGPMSPGWRGGISSEYNLFSNSADWKSAVRKTWMKDNATCQRCGLKRKDVPRSDMQFHVHHIVSRAISELRTNLDNLVLLCEVCHRYVHSNKNINNEFIIDYKEVEKHGLRYFFEKQECINRIFRV